MDSYFSGIGHPIPAQTNPAEFILDTVSSDFASSKDSGEDRVELIQTAWANSNEAKSLHRSFVKSYRDVIAYGIRIAMYLGKNHHASFKGYWD